MASFKRWLDRRRNPWKAPFHDAFRQWKRDRGDNRLFDYGTLPEGAVAFDLGGYRGDWTARVLTQQPAAHVHVFEPHPAFAGDLRARFAGDDRVEVHAFALGGQDGALALSDAGDASSALSGPDAQITGEVRSVSRFFDERDVPRIDLMKMNIEGGEYDLLPALIAAGVIGRIRRLQVQFHLFEPALAAARDDIRTRLRQTHDCAWEYPFVWEEWRLKSGG
jgi:FkbM family methyltransferase